MGLAAGDVVAVTYEGEYCNQQIRYCLHYACNNPGTSTTPELDLAAIANFFANNTVCQVTIELQKVHTAGFAFNGASAQRVSPNRTVNVRKLLSFPGTLAQVGMPPNAGFTITKRTLTAGRRGMGSLHLTAMGQNNVLNGEVDPAAMPTFNNLVIALAAAQTVSAVGLSLQPGLFNPTRPPTYFSPMFDCILQQTTRTMRRRTVRVGI